jgi:ABC-type multidrug transport system fused ATPase/permease subunit
MFLLLPVVIVGMILETLSVGVVIPALGILLSENYLDQFSFLKPLLQSLGQPSHEVLIVLGLCGLASAFLIKNVYLYFQISCQGTFVYSAQREIALSLFRKYLLSGYLFHLKTNSSELIRNLTTETSLYCSYFLMATINLVTEMLVIFALLGLILFVEPKGGFFLIFILGIVVFLFVRSTNKIVGKWGRLRLEAEGNKIKHLQHGFGGLKEILLSGKMEYFLRCFHHPNHLSGLMAKKEYIFQYVPKLGIETIAIFGLVGMCLFLITQGNPKEDVVHILGLMATAGFRMIPSFSRILNNLQSIRYGWASVSVLNKEFSIEPAQNTQEQDVNLNKGSTSIKFNDTITLQDVSYSYEVDSKGVLDQISLVIKKGETIGFAGESGSGKSTLANVILGLLEPSVGQVIVDKQVLSDDNLDSWQKMIGYVPQDVFLLDDTICRNIAFGLDDKDIDEQRVDEVIKMAKLNEFVQSTPEGKELLLGERGARLSGGQRQRIGIARALYHDPDILVFDEATSSLDNDTESEILATLEPLKETKTLLIIAHRSKALEMCSQVFTLKDGNLKER